MAGISSAPINTSVPAAAGTPRSAASSAILESIIWYCFRSYCMQSKYESFDRSRLLIKPLGERVHDLNIRSWLPLDAPENGFNDPALQPVAARLIAARSAGAARILMMGAHLLRAGTSRIL